MATGRFRCPTVATATAWTATATGSRAGRATPPEGAAVRPDPQRVRAHRPGKKRRRQEPYTSNSDTWPAGQPVLAVMVSRRYRWLVVARGMVTVLAVAGLKV